MIGNYKLSGEEYGARRNEYEESGETLMSAVLELMDDHEGGVMVTEGEKGEGEPPHVHTGSVAVTTQGDEGGTGDQSEEERKKDEAEGSGGEQQGGSGGEVPMIGTMEIGGF